MIPLQRVEGLVIKSDTAKGRGVFTTQSIKKGTIIDTCPVLVLPVQDNEQHVKHTELYHYTYNWPIQSDNNSTQLSQAVVFGLGSMFNHMRNPNIGWTRSLDDLVVIYKALRHIDQNEELCISYGDQLTFKDSDCLSDTEEIEESNALNIDPNYNYND